MRRSLGEKILRSFLPEERCEVLIGDLEEECLNSHRTSSWYWKEVAAAILHSGAGWIFFAVVAGLTAGALAYWIGTLGVRGPVVFIAYTTLVLVTAVYVHVRKATAFIQFATVLVAFMTTIIVHYFAIYQFDKHVGTISTSGHLWRLAVMLGFGLALSAAVTLLASGRPIGYAIGLGILGGGGAIVTMWTTGLRLLIVILAIVLLMAVSWLRAHRVESPFERFSLTMIGCAVSTFFVYVFLTKVANPRKVTIEVWSDLWANGLLLALITLCSILVARLTDAADHQPHAE